MNLKNFLTVSLATILFFSVGAQEKKFAVISGMVKDARTKTPLNEAVVTLSSDVFKGQKFALTDSTGMYKVANLPPGKYTITFEMEGYEKFVHENIALKEGMSLGVSFEMVKERKVRDKMGTETKEKVTAIKKEER